MRRRLATAGLLAALLAGEAPAASIGITHLLDPDVFGAPEAVIDGVMQRAAALWSAWLPDIAAKPADHPQNLDFEILVVGERVDASGENPANTLVPRIPRPDALLPILIEVNTDDDAVAAMFWDATPATTTAAEFSIDLGLGAGKWLAAKNDAGFDKFDMLTVMLHEIGHAIGFSRDYAEFATWADQVWNPLYPDNEIGTPAHFADARNLMSNAAGLPPAGKSGRSFIQAGDILALRGAFGYMPVPAPATPWLLVAALAAALALGAWRGAPPQRPQPLLRRPAAMPLMVRWMLRLTRSS